MNLEDSQVLEDLLNKKDPLNLETSINPEDLLKRKDPLNLEDSLNQEETLYQAYCLDALKFIDQQTCLICDTEFDSKILPVDLFNWSKIS